MCLEKSMCFLTALQYLLLLLLLLFLVIVFCIPEDMCFSCKILFSGFSRVGYNPGHASQIPLLPLAFRKHTGMLE